MLLKKILGVVLVSAFAMSAAQARDFRSPKKAVNIAPRASHSPQLKPARHHPERDGKLVRLELPGLFAANTKRLALRRGVYLRSYAYEFIRKRLGENR